MNNVNIDENITVFLNKLKLLNNIENDFKSQQILRVKMLAIYYI